MSRAAGVNASDADSLDHGGKSLVNFGLVFCERGLLGLQFFDRRQELFVGGSGRRLRVGSYGGDREENERQKSWFHVWSGNWCNP